MKDMEEELCDKEDLTVFKAMMGAKKTFNAVLSSAGYDPAYWRLDIKVEYLDSEFDKVLRIIRDTEVG